MTAEHMLPTPNTPQEGGEQHVPLRTRVGQKLGGAASRAAEVVQAAAADVKEAPNKGWHALTGVAMAGIQVADRLRTSVVLVPLTAVNTFEATHSPVAAAAAGGAAFGAWCLAVGGFTNEGLSQYPQATKKGRENFPGVMQFFEDSLPGLNNPTEEQKRQPRWKRVGRSILTHLHRSGVVIGVGTAAYSTTATFQGREKSDVRKLLANASADGGALAGGVIYGLANVIEEIGENDPLLAKHILDTAGDPKLWYGVAAVLMTTQRVSAWRQGRKAKNEAPDEQEQATVIAPVTPEQE